MTLKDLAEEFKRKKEELLKNIVPNQDLTANINKIQDLKPEEVDLNNKNNINNYNEGDNNINDLNNNNKEKDKNNDIDNNNDNNISTILTS